MPEITWTPHARPLGEWSWNTPYFANGWCASVADDSQVSAPKQKTRYTASAICQFWIVGYPEYIKTLAEAKRIAVQLALTQKQAEQDPKCRVEVKPNA